MSCADIRDLLSAHLDGALSPGEADAVAAHLEGCEKCRAHLRELETVVEIVKGIPAPPIPAGFAREVAAALPRRKRLPRILWFAPLAAAACLLLLVTFRGGVVEEGAAPREVASERLTAGDAGAAPVTRLEEEDRTAPVALEGSGEGVAEAEEPSPAPPAAPPLGKATAEPARSYAVRGADPDTAAGLILAELGHRRAPSGGGGVAGRVVQDARGEVAGMVLDLTDDELSFVTALLCERPGVHVDPLNGRHAKEARAESGTARRPSPSRYRVELRFRR